MRLAPVLWLVTAPLFAQNAQQPPMPGMAPGMKMDKMDHSSPPQSSGPGPAAVCKASPAVHR